jgi:hypothetical protein
VNAEPSKRDAHEKKKGETSVKDTRLQNHVEPGRTTPTPSERFTEVLKHGIIRSHHSGVRPPGSSLCDGKNLVENRWM